MPRHFFDTSALVKHDHAETGTDAVDRLIGEPGAEILIARLTLVETISVFAIKVRTGEFDAAEFARLRALFARQVARRQYQVFQLYSALELRHEERGDTVPELRRFLEIHLHGMNGRGRFHTSRFPRRTGAAESGRRGHRPVWPRPRG